MLEKTNNDTKSSHTQKTNASILKGATTQQLINLTPQKLKNFKNHKTQQPKNLARNTTNKRKTTLNTKKQPTTQ